ncbi:MAG: hypothetical protein KDA85_04635 [Planctomycetaceae bacterium]|nr:hypothetical protein [Planctomycetaceae bacterium]
MSMDARQLRWRCTAAHAGAARWNSAQPRVARAGIIAVLAAMAWATCLNIVVHAATYQTRNFSVTADSPELAREVGEAAEVYRRKLAIYWTGESLPNWSRPCRVRVREGAMLPASGQTTFQFSRGEVFDWKMVVNGSKERILDSVLPHEVNHTVFACYFRRPLPRWADEGAATLFEDRSEQVKQIGLLNQIIDGSSERFTLRQLLGMKEYPSKHRPMLILYAQGYSLADFLVQQKGQKTYLKFLNDGEKNGWEEAIRMNFDHAGIDSLEQNWQGWVLAGMPKMTAPRDTMLAEAKPELLPDANAAVARSAGAGRRTLPPGAMVRSQSPEPSTGRTVPVAATSMARSEETAAPSGNASLPADALFPTASAPRRASFEAPPPRSFPALRARAEAAVASQAVRSPTTERNPQAALRQQHSRVAGPEADSTAAGITEQDASTGRQLFFGQSSLPPGYEPTKFSEGTIREQGVRSSEIRNRQVLEPTEKPVDPQQDAVRSSADHLSDERGGSSRPLPQWAGFPGQQKLF